MNLNIFIGIFNNVTTLERFKMKTLKLPCIGPMNESNTVPNEFDMLWLPNFKQIMGSRIWMWPLPFIKQEMKGQGFFYPKIPEITMSDMNILLKDTSKTTNTSFASNEFESDPKEYIKKAFTKYGGKTFVISPGPDGGATREVYVPTESERQ